jgi:hypothetical protein
MVPVQASRLYLLSLVLLLSDALSCAAMTVPSAIDVGPEDDLAKAILRLRSLPPGTPRRIVLRGGRYLLDRPLELTASDSGLTIESMSGRRAELRGGRRIGGWQKMAGGPLWFADLPRKDARQWRFRMLVVDGFIALPSRLPEQGFYHDGNPDFDPKKETASKEDLTSLTYRVGDIGDGIDRMSAEVRVYRIWDESLSKIDSIDDQHHVLHLTTPIRYPAGAFKVHNYELLNVRGGLRSPGQWFLDYRTNRVYYLPRPQEDMRSAEVWAPLTERLINISGTQREPVRNISLKNLDLTLTDAPATSAGSFGFDYDGAVRVTRAEDIVISDLHIYQVAGVGIKVTDSERVHILSCVLHEIGACAIAMRSVLEAEVGDCFIYSIGHMTPAATGMHLAGDRIHVHHNEVVDAPYTGISIQGMNGLVEFNRVHRVMLKMADGAAFYTNGKEGIVRNNWAYDVSTFGQDQSPAYYLDDLTTRYLVEHNVAQVANWVLQVHNAVDNAFRDNVFVADGDLRVELRLSKSTSIERNILQSGGLIQINASSESISLLKGNLFHSARGAGPLIRSDETGVTVPLGLADNMVGDPRLIATEKHDLGWRQGSLAIQVGISTPVSISETGPRPHSP